MQSSFTSLELNASNKNHEYDADAELSANGKLKLINDE